MIRNLDGSRRALLGVGGVFGLTVLAAATPLAATAKPADRDQKEKKNERTSERDEKGEKSEKTEEDIGPGEDLMREHGVLRRVLLVYSDITRRLEANGGDFDVGTIQMSARIVRRFIEDYHERQEEEMVFPRFERAHKLVDLVRILRVQHQAGRKVTARIQGLATSAAVKDPAQRRQLRDDLLAFIRMYEPHASREDTVLFPALHDLVSRHEYDALGEDFERREHQTFGADGFENAVAEVAAIEKRLGIEDLAQFTPAA